MIVELNSVGERAADVQQGFKAMVVHALLPEREDRARCSHRWPDFNRRRSPLRAGIPWRCLMLALVHAENLIRGAKHFYMPVLEPDDLIAHSPNDII